MPCILPVTCERLPSDNGSCDGQVKTDTELSHPGQLLEVIGTDIP
jgi:hypothetical protein